MDVHMQTWRLQETQGGEHVAADLSALPGGSARQAEAEGGSEPVEPSACALGRIRLGWCLVWGAGEEFQPHTTRRHERDTGSESSTKEELEGDLHPTACRVEGVVEATGSKLHPPRVHTQVGLAAYSQPADIAHDRALHPCGVCADWQVSREQSGEFPDVGGLGSHQPRGSPSPHA